MSTTAPPRERSDSAGWPTGARREGVTGERHHRRGRRGRLRGLLRRTDPGVPGRHRPRHGRRLRDVRRVALLFGAIAVAVVVRRRRRGPVPMFKPASSASQLGVPACRCHRRGSERPRQARARSHFDPMSGTWLMVALDVAWVTTITLGVLARSRRSGRGRCSSGGRLRTRRRPRPVRLHRCTAALLPASPAR